MAQNGSKLPWFPFFPKDWLSDDKVIAMNRAQRGSYFNLLCFAWHQEPIGTLPNDAKLLARLAQCTEEEWATEHKVIMAPFKLAKAENGLPGLEGTRWHQKRMMAVGLTQSTNHEKFVEAGRKGGHSRAEARLKGGLSQPQAYASDSVSVSDSSSFSLVPEEQKKRTTTKGQPPPKAKEARPKTFKDMVDFALGHGMTEQDAKYCWHRWNASGWIIGKQPIKSWRDAMVSWRINGYLPSTKAAS
jgi:uncharacterized protein YdaU (DUF1376 family)